MFLDQVNKINDKLGMKSKTVQKPKMSSVVELGSSNTNNSINGISVIVDDNSNEKDILFGIVNEFNQALKSTKKCILFAVCRGKVSEGIDFSDDKGRIVIITGNKSYFIVFMKNSMSYI